MHLLYLHVSAFASFLGREAVSNTTCQATTFMFRLEVTRIPWNCSDSGLQSKSHQRMICWFVSYSFHNVVVSLYVTSCVIDKYLIQLENIKPCVHSNDLTQDETFNLSITRYGVRSTHLSVHGNCPSVYNLLQFGISECTLSAKPIWYCIHWATTISVDNKKIRRFKCTFVGFIFVR